MHGHCDTRPKLTFSAKDRDHSLGTVKFSFLQYYAKNLAGKNVYETPYFVSSGA